MFVATRLSWIQLKMILVQRAAMEMAKRHEAMDATGVDGQFAAWMAAECVRDLLVQVDHHRLWVRIDLRQCKLELKISHALINLPAFGLGAVIVEGGVVIIGASSPWLPSCVGSAKCGKAPAILRSLKLASTVANKCSVPWSLTKPENLAIIRLTIFQVCASIFAACKSECQILACLVLLEGGLVTSKNEDCHIQKKTSNLV